MTSHSDLVRRDHAGSAAQGLRLRHFSDGGKRRRSEPLLDRAEKRGVIPLDGFHVPAQARAHGRAERFEIRIDGDFDAVIDGVRRAAAGRSKTWINPRIRTALLAAYSGAVTVTAVEAWREGQLVGGLYGVWLGRAFFGESMFHLERAMRPRWRWCISWRGCARRISRCSTRSS
jgi:hypothetical protein